jgi:hypothetical protein
MDNVILHNVCVYHFWQTLTKLYLSTREFYRFKRLVAYAKCNRTSHERRIYLVVFKFHFLFCIAKRLAICKFRGVISDECCTFKPFNLHMSIP